MAPEFIVDLLSKDSSSGPSLRWESVLSSMFRLGSLGMWQNPAYHRELIGFDWHLWKNMGECLRRCQIKLSDVILIKLVKGIAPFEKPTMGSLQAFSFFSSLRVFSGDSAMNCFMIEVIQVPRSSILSDNFVPSFYPNFLPFIMDIIKGIPLGRARFRCFRIPLLMTLKSLRAHFFELLKERMVTLPRL